MKANLQPTHWLGLRRRLLRWSGQPAVEAAGQALAALAAGFSLAGATAAGTWLPLPICLAAALGLGLPSFAAYLGGCVGYGVFLGGAHALEPMAAGLLVEAAMCVFSDPEDRLLRAGSAAAFTALVGFLYLLEQRFAPNMLWRWGLRLGVAFGGTLCARAALEGKSRLCRLAALACLCAGLCAIRPVGLPLGAVLACALGASALGTEQALPAAVLCGLALDLCWGEGQATAVLALAALAGRGQLWFLRLLLWLVALLGGILLTGTSSLLLAAAIPGVLLSRLLPTQWLLEPEQLKQLREDQRLLAAAGLLEQLCQCLDAGLRPQADPETAAVYDRAAERVCRMCSLWDDCWGENVQQTVEALDRAAPAMMTRGKALREDLPALFANRCRHLEGFLTAVNRELDDLSCRRQCRSRVRESRRVLARQYGILAQALCRETPEPPTPLRYQAEVGFRSQGRREDSVSGDRGASFRVGQFFYLLLCDGMGTGSAASAEAGAAIGILRTLLQAGTLPSEALELLNGIYILRDDGGFATVDLVRADLCSGEATLWKWGSAPSYWKSRGQVEKLGTASPPPGLGQELLPEQTRLSLSRGEMLVLTSDGAGGEGAERFLRQYTGPSPKELAAGIVNCSAGRGEDDQTAAVLTLRAKML